MNETTYPTSSGQFDWNAIDTIVWDWNGTLLDDVVVNLKVINEMLSRRNLPLLNLPVYKKLFCFPVQTFQTQIGFDFDVESMEAVSLEYHTTYQSYEKEIRLNPDAFPVLDALRQKGMKQYVLSASQREYLVEAIEDFGLTDQFDAVYGVSDVHATGKIEIGKQLIQDHSLDPEKTLVVGDTLHDAKVAEALGSPHVLYAGGHNSYDLLSRESVVINSLSELIDSVDYKK